VAQGVVLSLGSVNVDAQVHAARWPEMEETLPTERFALLAGGKAANVAFLARKLGVPAWLVAHLGDDMLSEYTLAPLREIGVDLQWARCMPGEQTGMALAVVHPNGQKGILFAENANGRWTGDECNEALQAIAQAPDGSVLAVNLEIPPDVVIACVDAAHLRGIRVIFDPRPRTACQSPS
jgi:ribokinase